MAQITKETIDRINELYHKSKDVGLTPEETEEQRVLRGQYIAAIRENMRGQLNNIDIQHSDGTIEHVSDRAKNKRRYNH